MVEIVLRLVGRAMCTVGRVRRLAGNALGLTGRVLRMVESYMRLVYRVLRMVGRAQNMGLVGPWDCLGGP